MAIRDVARGLRIKNNGTTPGSVIDVQAAEVCLEDQSGNNYEAQNVQLSINIEQIGPNGLDVGPEQANCWYYIFLIATTSGNVAGLFSLDPVNPALPVDFVFKALIGAVRNEFNSGTDFCLISQVDRFVARNSMAVLTAGNATTRTAIDCSSGLPVIAGVAYGYMQLNFAVAGFGEGYLYSTPDVGGISLAGSGSVSIKAPFAIPVVEVQRLYYNYNAGNQVASATVAIGGFEIAI